MARRFKNPWIFYLVADILAVVGSYVLTMLLRFHSSVGETVFAKAYALVGLQESGALGETLQAFYWESAPRIILLLCLTLCVLYALRDLYTQRRFIVPQPLAAEVIVASLIALGLFYAYFYLRRNLFHPRSFFATVMVFNVMGCVLLRSLVDRVVAALRRRGIDRCPVILIGVGREASTIERIIEASQPHGMFIAGRLPAAPHAAFESVLAEAQALARKHDAGMLMLVDKNLTVAQIMRFLDMADRLDLPVKILSDKLDVIINRARIRFDMIHGSPLLHFTEPSLARRFQGLKRVISWLTAGVMLAMLSPLLVAIAAAIKLTSRGPVFFIQERIGVNRRPFRMYKFRTMRNRADEVQAEVEALNESGHGIFKVRDDPRVTAVGRILRRYSLDELPQLINVIRGEMTLVGPRPLPRRDFENYYEEWHYGRHNGMPGLTCLWQVSGRSELDFHNMCILDMFYLRNQNWVLDARILLRTFGVVMFAHGAY